MKLYIYSLYDIKTGELAAKGTAKELKEKGWYSTTDSVYQAYKAQERKSKDRRFYKWNIRREVFERPVKQPKPPKQPKKPEPLKIKGIPDPTPLQLDVHKLLGYNAAARQMGRRELSYGFWADAGRPEAPVW